MELPEMAEALRHMMGSRGWTEVVRPALEKMNTNCHQQARYGSKLGHSHEVLRGYGMALDWMLSWDRKADKLAQELQAALTEQMETMENEGGVGTIYAKE